MRPSILALALLTAAGTSYAGEIGVVGLFTDKAVLVLDNASPKTYNVGSVLGEGVKLISVDDSTATIDVNGKRQVIAIGQYVIRSTVTAAPSLKMQANGQGHFVVSGQINGGAATMLVDTGATVIALPSTDAKRLGIDYKKGKVIAVSTANGTTPAYLVKLNTVKIGDIEMNQIDAVVQENGLPIILLGMSFLNRMEMHRDGDQMTLTKRF